MLCCSAPAHTLYALSIISLPSVIFHLLGRQTSLHEEDVKGLHLQLGLLLSLLGWCPCLTLLSLTPWKLNPSRLLESPVMKQSLSAYHFHIADRSVASVFYRHLSDIASSALSEFYQPYRTLQPPPQLPQVYAVHTRSASNPLLLKLPKYRIMAHLHSLISMFFPPVEPTYSVSSISSFPPGLQDNSSLPSQVPLPSPIPIHDLSTPINAHQAHVFPSFQFFLPLL